MKMNKLFTATLLVFAAAASAQAPQKTAPKTPSELTRQQAEQLALKNNPRISAAHLLALVMGQNTRIARSAELPQIITNISALDAADGSRIGAAPINPSRLYTYAGAGGTFQQLITDFGRTHFQVAAANLMQHAQESNALATEQEILLATDQAFYRLLDAQSLLNVAKAAVKSRTDSYTLTEALTKTKLKSDLDLNLAAANLSQAQLLQLDAENAVATAQYSLAYLLSDTGNPVYHAVEDASALPPPPEFTTAMMDAAHAQRPDLRALQFQTSADLANFKAQRAQNFPVITANAIGGITPVRTDTVFTQNWYAAGGVNLNLPAFTGFRISAQTKQAKLQQLTDDKMRADLQNSIDSELQKAVLNLHTAWDRITVTEKFETQANQAYALATTRYQLGLSSIVELSQAELESTQASVAAVNARYDYLMAQRALDYQRGLLTQ